MSTSCCCKRADAGVHAHKMSCCAGLPLAEERPDLAAQWHPTKNKTDVSPATITCGSGKRVWWLCTAGQCGHHHAWEARVDTRVALKRGCPICAGQKPCWCNSLKALHPLTVELQWDYERNKSQPEDLRPRSSKLVHWHCTKHDPPCLWMATPDKRFSKHRPSGCPECARLRRSKPSKQPPDAA